MTTAPPAPEPRPLLPVLCAAAGCGALAGTCVVGFAAALAGIYFYAYALCR